jgi:RNA polymerase sigma-70 factor, ECF subfamily
MSLVEVSTTLPTMAVVEVRASFEDLYRRSFPGLVGVATALTGSSEDARDLVQDTMIRAFVRWPHVSRLDAPTAWCHRVLTNACRSWWRRRQTERRHQWRFQPRSTDAVTGDAVLFWDAARALPTRPRTVVALHFAGEYTMAEIAQILGVPEGTVRSDIARARVIILAALGAGS